MYTHIHLCMYPSLSLYIYIYIYMWSIHKARIRISEGLTQGDNGKFFRIPHIQSFRPEKCPA